MVLGASTGTRAVLAGKLITSQVTLKQFTAAPTMGRAEALRRSMIALMTTVEAPEMRIQPIE